MPVDCRAFGEAINLAVSNPRITEWLIAGNLSPDSFHMPFGIFNIFRAQNSTFSLLDVGHFITGEGAWTGNSSNNYSKNSWSTTTMAKKHREIFSKQTRNAFPWPGYSRVYRRRLITEAREPMTVTRPAVSRP